MKVTVWLVIFILVLFACSRKSIPATIPGSSEPTTMNAIVKTVNKNMFTAFKIQARGQVSLEEGGFFSSGTLNLRVIKDSLIWFSISKLGFELARGLINRDSAFAVNHWDNTYWKGSLHNIAEKYAVPATFDDILAIGFPHLNNTIEYLEEKNTNENLVIKQPGALHKTFIVSKAPEYLILSQSISQFAADFNANYSDYQLKNSLWFPYIHTHSIRKDNEIHHTKIKFTSVESVDKLNTPFSIPDDYEYIN